MNSTCLLKFLIELDNLSCSSVTAAEELASSVCAYLRVEGDDDTRAQVVRILAQVLGCRNLDVSTFADQLLSFVEDEFEGKETKVASLEALSQIYEFHALGSFGAKLPQVLEAVTKVLCCQEPRLRSKALALLATLAKEARGTCSGDLEEVAIPFVLDWDTAVRAQALRALCVLTGASENPHPKARVSSIGALQDDSEEVRLQAVRLLVACTRHNPEEIVGQRFGDQVRQVDDTFLRACNAATDACSRVRVSALLALSELGSASSAVKMQALNRKV